MHDDQPENPEMTALVDIPQLERSLSRIAPEVASVLDADPDLAATIPAEHRLSATRHSVAPVMSFSRGPWSFTPPGDAGGLGALVLEGLILVRIEVADRCHGELLGEGDVISPWVRVGPEVMVPTTVSARVVSPVRVALLDRSFTMRTARWPEIHAGIVHRLILRSRRLSLQSAINSIPRTQQRLELTLWHLAHRYGRVTSGGLKLSLPLSHAQLAEIVATQRPSVTIALARMQEDGRLIRTGPHQWLLTGPSPAELAPLAEQCGVDV
jgi:CRP-like cAMP-binding protein